MMLAESFATNVNWTLIFTAVMAIATVLMWADSRKSRLTEIKQPLAVSGTPPGNSELQMSVKQLNARMKVLEQWRAELTTKMDEDKNEILLAGEHRAEKLHERINVILSAVSELKGTVNEISRHNS